MVSRGAGVLESGLADHKARAGSAQHAASPDSQDAVSHLPRHEGPQAELLLAFHSVEGDDGLCASRAWLSPLFSRLATCCHHHKSAPEPWAPAIHHCSQGSARPALSSPEVEIMQRGGGILAPFSDWLSGLQSVQSSQCVALGHWALSPRFPPVSPPGCWLLLLALGMGGATVGQLAPCLCPRP